VTLCTKGNVKFVINLSGVLFPPLPFFGERGDSSQENNNNLKLKTMGKIVKRDRAVKQLAASNLKSVKLEKGEVLTLVDIEESDIEINGKSRPNDIVVFSTSKGLKRTSLGEVLRFRLEDGSTLMNQEEGDLEIPSQIKIHGSEDRVSSVTGEPIYPVMAYKAFEKQREAGNGIDWNALVESGVKADNKYAPVQNYTIELV
jgi:hypothetical protein